MLDRLLLRIGAAVALALYAAIIFLAVRLVILSPGLALALAPTAAMLLYGSWLVFTGKGMRKYRGILLLAISIAAVAIEITLFFREADRVRLGVGIAIMTFLYAGCIGLLQAAYWREKRRHSSGQAAFDHPYLIINPSSGNGRAIKARVDSLAKQQGIQVIALQKGDAMETAALAAVQQGADILGVSGGDGSIGAVAKVAMEHGLPIVVLPGGTRCHFARDLGLNPAKIVDALTAFNGVERIIDVGSINGRIFLNNASFGLYADIVQHELYRTHKLQVTRGVLLDILNGIKQPYDLQFDHGSHHFARAVQVVVAVNKYATFNALDPGRRERLDGGILQISVISTLDDSLVRQLLRTVSIDQLSRKRELSGFDQWEAQTFRITSHDSSLTVGVDGEHTSYSTPVEVRILPRVLRVYVPPEGVRNRPEQPLSPSMIHYLWQEAVHGHRP